MERKRRLGQQRTRRRVDQALHAEVRWRNSDFECSWYCTRLDLVPSNVGIS